MKLCYFEFTEMVSLVVNDLGFFLGLEKWNVEKEKVLRYINFPCEL